ncbi:MAG: DUF3168 domain-containing protein [Alphaproteobacteria bacterium]
MTSSAWSLQAAIRSALETNADLIALVGNPPPVHDRVPTGAQLPYIAFGDWKVDENDADDARIDLHAIMIDVWSSYAGLKQAKAIAIVIEAALHGAALTLDGYALIDLSFVASVFSQDQKEQISRATLRFRALTQKSE